MHVPSSWSKLFLGMLGYRTRESVLKLNKDVFVLGNWSSQGRGVQTIQVKGTGDSEKPFLMRLGTPEEYIEHQEFWSTNFKVGSGLLGVGGAALCFIQPDR